MDEILGNVLLGVPEYIANLQLPDPVLRDWYKDEQNRIFWVNSQIDDTLLDLVKMIMKCNAEDTKILTLEFALIPKYEKIFSIIQ